MDLLNIILSHSSVKQDKLLDLPSGMRLAFNTMDCDPSVNWWDGDAHEGKLAL